MSYCADLFFDEDFSKLNEQTKAEADRLWEEINDNKYDLGSFDVKSAKTNQLKMLAESFKKKRKLMEKMQDMMQEQKKIFVEGN